MSYNVNSIDRVVGLNILSQRMALGMQSSELANKLNISQKQLSQIEAGNVRTEVSLLSKLAGVFSIPVSELLISGNLALLENGTKPRIISEIHELMDAFVRINSRAERDWVIKLAKSMANV